MKLNKILCGLALGMATLFTACDTDNVGAVYDGTSANTGQGISFATTKLRAVSVKATDPKFQISIFRSNSNGDYTGKVSTLGLIGKDTVDCYKVSDFAFKNGESESKITVDVSELEIGKILALTLSFTDSLNMGYSNKESLTVNVKVEYNWQSLGKGKFADNWLEYESEVEMLKADGFDRYRIVAPYAAYLASSQAVADWGADWLDPNSTVNPLEVWIEDGLVFYDDFPLGINYEASKDQPIYGYHPWGWSSMQDPSFWAHNKIDGKVIQLAPYYYIDGLGGWNYTQKDGVILITLP